ncbi:Sulfite exporter TauE/SafE [Seminavis robusta]|uniref:Sulfite exporter TauE/SafE n=1 Tax=Seminavis robusta TaxID=568900 RepID=A0A9N8EZC7_9STRA|nr:Sulfite exporter TauE/SafE [Seminavis robusta]|eukprot:Sro2717_g335400.1 Sulfite exporter TauE/SafE (814) ;mRNA; f:3968-6409
MVKITAIPRTRLLLLMSIWISVVACQEITDSYPTERTLEDTTTSNNESTTMNAHAHAHAHAPRQHHHPHHGTSLHGHNNNNSPARSRRSTTGIHVLPPSPDDTPEACPANSTFHASCGAERYCASLPGTHHDNHHDDDNNQNNTNHSLWFEWDNTIPYNADETYYYCLHKTLWFPTLSPQDLLAFLLAGTCCFLAAMAGIGGGGLILPILLLCCNFTPKEASVLSNTAVFCNTLGQFVINNCCNNNRNNHNNNPSILIFATVLMIMPPVIAGGSVAITLEGMVPSTVILLLALVTLLLATTKTYHKARKMRLAEQEEFELLTVEETQPPPLAASQSEVMTTMMMPLEMEINNDQQEPRQDDALLASALDWGGDRPATMRDIAVSPGSRKSMELLDAVNSENHDILEETFLGSIRYLSKDEEDNSEVLIVDESSLATSSQSSTPTNGHSRKMATENTAETQEVDEEEGLPASAPVISESVQQSSDDEECPNGLCNRMMHHKLQLLIGGFWVLDAVTFLLLHAGTLIPKCSPAFVVLVCFPALVAAVFVGLGRSQLLSIQQQATAAALPSSYRTDDDQRPLLAASFDDEEEEEPDANGQTMDESPQQQSATEPTSNGMMSLVTSFFKRMRRQRALRVLTRQDSPSGRRPLLSSRSFSSVDEDADQDEEVVAHHDNFQSLLAWWLPWACIVIGLLSALLGIGGGELLGPILLLLLKMDPQQSSATTAIMSMMNSGTNLMHYIVADMMIAPGYAINLGMAGLVGGVGGRLWAMSMAQRGRPSVIALSLTGVLALATALVAWELLTTPLSLKSSGGVC